MRHVGPQVHLAEPYMVLSRDIIAVFVYSMMLI